MGGDALELLDGFHLVMRTRWLLYRLKSWRCCFGPVISVAVHPGRPF